LPICQKTPMSVPSTRRPRAPSRLLLSLPVNDQPCESIARRWSGRISCKSCPKRAGTFLGRPRSLVLSAPTYTSRFVPTEFVAEKDERLTACRSPSEVLESVRGRFTRRWRGGGGRRRRKASTGAGVSWLRL